MRTSRIANETQRAINASVASRSVATRRSSRRTANGVLGAEDKPTKEGLEESPLSSPLSFHNDDKHARSVDLRKRKRAAAASSAKTIPLDQTTVRRSSRKAPKLEDEGETKPRKTKRQPAKHIQGPHDLVTLPPPNWERVYDTTAAMRKRVLAPVDTMGCESLAEDQRSPQDRRLQTLVALMLSSQTKDTVTAAAMQNLQQNLPGGFCLQGLLDVEPGDFNDFIQKVGFHNNKTKFIKSTAIIIRDEHNGDIPDTIEGLVSLPGVGPKMAYLCMSAAWGRDEGIGVDVHVHRITNLWGWHKTSTPEQTRAELESWLPKEKWHDINHLLVGLGQTICLPVGRKCGECDLAKDKLCPSIVASSPVKRRVKKEVQVRSDPDGEVKTVVKDERVEVQQDDVGVKVEVETMDAGNVVEVQAAPVAQDYTSVAPAVIER